MNQQTQITDAIRLHVQVCFVTTLLNLGEKIDKKKKKTEFTNGIKFPTLL